MQGVLGYVILRPLMTAVGFVASLIGVYGDGELRFDRVYLYTTIVSNISQVGQDTRHALPFCDACMGCCAMHSHLETCRKSYMAPSTTAPKTVDSCSVRPEA